MCHAAAAPGRVKWAFEGLRSDATGHTTDDVRYEALVVLDEASICNRAKKFQKPYHKRRTSHVTDARPPWLRRPSRPTPCLAL